MAKVNGLVKADLSDIFSMEMIRSLFRGVGQVMFQNNGITGLLFMVAFACAMGKNTLMQSLYRAFCGLCVG